MKLKYTSILAGVILALLVCCHAAKKKVKELQINVLDKPSSCDRKTAVGDKIRIHYTGKLENGQTFDTSLQEGREPFEFTLGKGMVIKGWEKGLLNMCVEEKRQLIIPSHLAYGERGYPPVIPANAVLIFETQLISIANNATASKTWYWIAVAVFVMLGFIFRARNKPAKDEPRKSKGSDKKGGRVNPKKKR